MTSLRDTFVPILRRFLDEFLNYTLDWIKSCSPAPNIVLSFRFNNPLAYTHSCFNWRHLKFH